MAITAARAVIERAIAGRVFPAAAIEIGSGADVLWREAFGTLTFDAASPLANPETPFDLASLTKPIATATVVMNLVAGGRLRLDERASGFFHGWRGADRETATVRDLLEHAAGLPARLAGAVPGNRLEFERAICATPLAYLPRTASTYSDLGFVLLGFLAADRGGASLAAQFADVLVQLKLDQAAALMFGLSPDARAHAAPTLAMDEDPRRGRMLVGEVHDNYAAALGGIAGHAGLFGTAAGVGAFSRLALRAARGDDRVP